MMLARFLGVMRGVREMTMRYLGVMTGFMVIAGVVLLRGAPMMRSGVFVMFGGLGRGAQQLLST